MLNCCWDRLRLLIISNSSGKNPDPISYPTLTKYLTIMSTSLLTSKVTPFPPTEFSISQAVEISKLPRFKQNLKKWEKTKNIWKPHEQSRNSPKRLTRMKLRILRMHLQQSSLCRMTLTWWQILSMTMWQLLASSWKGFRLRWSGRQMRKKNM